MQRKDYKGHEKMMAKLAWSFARTTNFDFEDLMSEACVAYAKVHGKYDPARAQFSTVLFCAVRNQLCDYVHKQRRRYSVETDMISKMPATSYEHRTPEMITAFREAIAGLGKDTVEIFNIVVNSPREFAGLTACKARVALRRQLREQGWTGRRVEAGFEAIRTTLMHC
jgi:RNA polymerase sigma factor (sigma-70 family)